MPRRIRIEVEDARDLRSDEGAVPLDVVDSNTYEKVPERIEGAVRIDPEEVADRYHELPKDKPVLAYCT